MSLPDHWWLLALVVVVQGLFSRGSLFYECAGKEYNPWRVRRWPPLAVSGLAGLAYGVVQRDPLFFLGQACLLVLYYRMQRERNDLG